MQSRADNRLWLRFRKYTNIFTLVYTEQARNQLETSGGARSFLRRAKNFQTTVCSIFLNYAQHTFLGGSEKYCRGGFAPPGYGPDTEWVKHMQAWVEAMVYLGYGRHGMCYGRHFGRGPKIAWKKLALRPNCGIVT